MVTKQTDASVQNDGNFSQIDQLNQREGILERIEVFRCSQPRGRYGVTAAGTPVDVICGEEHLGDDANRVHRSLYSEGQDSARLPVLFELREEMNPEGQPEGSWDIRLRDLDASSPTFGLTLRTVFKPQRSTQTRQAGKSSVLPERRPEYEIDYELRFEAVDPVPLFSPLEVPVHEAVPDLADIGADPDVLADESDDVPGSLSVEIEDGGDPDTYQESVGELRALTESDRYRTWFDNVESFLRFGDLGPKSVHPGTNLTGEYSARAAEYLVWRKYRVVMAAAGLPFDPAMTEATRPIEGPLRPEIDAKPGVYSIYAMANTLGIGVYELVLDKVYSDYGGVPMEQQPGSRLETGREPVLDAAPAIKTVADIAEAYYLQT